MVQFYFGEWALSNLVHGNGSSTIVDRVGLDSKQLVGDRTTEITERALRTAYGHLDNAVWLLNCQAEVPTIKHQLYCDNGCIYLKL